MGGARRLRELLAGPGAVIVPGAANALTARIIQEAGFECVFFTGAGFANMSFAVPDLGLITLTEIVQEVGRISEAVEIPLIADGDTGHGGVFNVRRTVRQLEGAGAAAVTLEDQVFPKRCGHFENKEVIPVEEMLAKIRTALDARRNPDTVIIARTDAGAVSGIDRAIERAQLYAEAGADVTFVEAPTTVDELELIPKRISVPQLVNVVVGGRTPALPAKQLESMGFKIILYANYALQAAIKGMQTALSVLARDGDSESVADQLATFQERQRLVRLPEYLAAGRSASSGSAARPESDLSLVEGQGTAKK